jgi:toxin-antitoxin system PIN domain toxin
MAATLLDVNVLLAVLSADSEFHVTARKWFLNNARRGWATCPFTEAGFVRVISNPASSQHSIKPGQAIEVLEESFGFPVHEFWKDDLSMAEATADFRKYLTGHQQTTDAYLLGLALRRRGKIVTFDRGFAALASFAGLSHLVTFITK